MKRVKTVTGKSGSVFESTFAEAIKEIDAKHLAVTSISYAATPIGSSPEVMCTAFISYEGHEEHAKEAGAEGIG